LFLRENRYIADTSRLCKTPELRFGQVALVRAG